MATVCLEGSDGVMGAAPCPQLCNRRMFLKPFPLSHSHVNDSQMQTSRSAHSPLALLWAGGATFLMIRLLLVTRVTLVL
jgi:hypothetical protein